MGTLWNTYAFFVLYANIDEFDATKYTLDYEKLSVMDKWLLSKLNSMIKEVDYDLGNYRIPEAARALQDFVDDMSNWYVSCLLYTSHISPWGLSWDDENYYLIGYDSDAEQIRHYRVDKMLRIQMSKEDREGREHFKKLDMADYARKSFGMFRGEEQQVKLLVNNRMAGVIRCV